MSTNPKKTNVQDSSSLEELLIKRLDHTARISIERISKEINFTFGSNDWSTDEIQKKIRYLLRQYMPNTDEETYLVCQAVLIVRAAETFCGSKSVYGSDKTGSAGQLALQREVEKEIQDSKKYLEEEEEQDKKEHFQHLTDLIRELYRLHARIIEYIKNPK